jgi:hypothetical protein
MMCAARDAKEQARECDGAIEVVLRQSNIEASPKWKRNRHNGEGKRWLKHKSTIARKQ